jgi:hypothetical protein
MGYDQTQLLSIATPNMNIFNITADNVILINFLIYVGVSGNVGVNVDGTAAGIIFQNVNLIPLI